MKSVMKDLLLVQSFDLNILIEEYRLFFIGLLPSVFIIAVIIEYLDRLEPFSLVKRAVISVLILTTITTFYQKSISASMNVADEVLRGQTQGNILLMDMFDGVKHWDELKGKLKSKDFYKNKNALSGTFSFLKYHLFDSFVNDGFTVTIFFITKICFLILKVVYSLVYYLGYGLIGIPCLIYLFPSMGNVLRGAVLSFLWCLIIPHILVFIISLISTEINKGYVSGQIIGGTMIGTALLFILTLFIAFSPLIGSMILNGSGVSQAGGIIASIGANYVMNLPKNSVNTGASILTGGGLGPKMKLASNIASSGSYRLASGAKSLFSNASSLPEKSSKSDSSQTGTTRGQGINSSLYRGKVNTRENVLSGNAATKNMTTKEEMQNRRTNSFHGSRHSESKNTDQRSQNNGTISKHGKINRQPQKTSNIYSSDKRHHAHNNSSNRSNVKSRKSK